MDRRRFLKSAGATGLAVGSYRAIANADVPEHSWYKYDWGSGASVPDRPRPTGIHQAMLMLPEGSRWEGLRLKAELEVKGVRYPVRWACRQKLNSDGSLTLRHNYNPQQPLV